MNLTPDDARVAVSRVLIKAQQWHGAAVVLAECADDGSNDPEVWCGLGLALLGIRRPGKRKQLETAACAVFRRGLPTTRNTPFRAISERWLEELGDDIGPIEPEQVSELIEFLLDSEDVLPLAIDALAPKDQMFAVMMLGDHSAHAAPVMRRAIEGRWGPAAGRSALKRVRRHLNRVDVRAAVVNAARSAERDELEPYLTAVLERIGHNG